MTPEQLTQAGVTGLLAIIVAAFFTTRVVPKGAVDEAKKESDEFWGQIVALWKERHADAIADRDAWKAQAQQLAPAVDKIGDELEAANKRDEEWLAAIQRATPGGTIPDRRASS